MTSPRINWIRMARDFLLAATVTFLPLYAFVEATHG